MKDGLRALLPSYAVGRVGRLRGVTRRIRWYVGVAMPLAAAACVVPITPGLAPELAAGSHICSSDPLDIHPCSHAPPEPSFSHTPEEPERRQEVAFVSTSRANPDRSISESRWDLDGDGQFDDATGASASWTFYRSGTHVVGLRIQDSDGVVAQVTKSISVTTPELPLPGSDDASTFQLNPQHDGFLDAAQPAPPLTLQWRRDLGESVSYAVVGDMRAYIVASAYRENEVQAYHGSVVYGLDLETGQTEWSRRLGVSRISPAYANGRVFVATDEGILLALDGETGRTLWATGANVTLGLEGHLVVADHHLYVSDMSAGSLRVFDTATGEAVTETRSWGGGGAPAFSSNDLFTSARCPGISAIDRFSFRTQWFIHNECTGGVNDFTPSYADGTLYAPEDRNSQSLAGRVVNAESGEVLGSFESQSTPAVAGAVTIYSRDRLLIAVNNLTGEELWRFGGGTIATHPLIVGSTVYVADFNSRVYALELATGDVVWSEDSGSGIATSKYGELPAMAAADGYLVIPHSGGELAAMAQRARPGQSADDNPEGAAGGSGLLSTVPPAGSGSGSAVAYLQNPQHNAFLNVDYPARIERAWHTDIDDIGTPLIAGGRVFLTANRASEQLLALNAQTGERLWAVSLPDADYPRYESAYDQGRVYVTTWSGDILAFRASDGERLWIAEGPAGGHHYETPPVAMDGLVFRMESHLDVFDGSSGERVSHLPVNGGGESSPTVTSDSVYAAWRLRNFYAFDREPFALRWAYPTCCGALGGSTAVFHEGRLYARHGPDGWILDAQDGETLDGFSATLPPAFAGQIGVFADGQTVYALNTETREVLWTYRSSGSVFSGPLLVGRHAYVAARDGSVYALNLATGVVDWSVTIPPPGDMGRRAVSMSGGQGLIVVPTDRGTTAFRVAPGGATPPETQIDYGPDGPVDGYAVRFGFHSDTPGATFQCRFGHEPFRPCESGEPLETFEPDGPARFEVRAVNSSSVADPTPASRTVLLDKASPVARITSGPRGRTRDRTPTFGFVADESVARFTCRIDGGRWRSCLSPYTTSRLALGRHVFAVLAHDAAGNYLDPAYRQFRVVRR